ncbi:ATP-binding protein [Shewanella amazonensis]|uniref:histidine kinase n=1 Tax=Shewanella amazonensis (strain ATCC BAA-1098 / SB2B) TaxID=326297 RepID=A1S301_SHEAM|nr:ATP-binding protein [Shewanella amazonensis]ABL98757.1 sensor histidine kinase [Shewanella amazonensis SB2B]
MLGFSRQAVSSKIGRRLMISIVLFSSLITLITTGYQLFNDYNGDLNRIDRAFSNIEKVNLDVLAASIWVIDERLINTQLEGLIQLPDITYISIDDDSGQHWSRGAPIDKNFIEKVFSLNYNSGSESISVGKLTILADLNAVYERIYDKAIIILLSNAIKTFLVAGMILILVWLNITRHLNTLAAYCQDISVEHEYQPLTFQKRGAQNEFDQVALAINEMQEQLHRSFGALKKSKSDLQHALEDRERLLELERSYKEELAKQVKERTMELEQSLLILKRAQEALVEQEKMAALGGLVSGVAHEINTPIGICLTAASTQLAHIDELISLIHSEEATLEEINAILEEYQQSCELIVSNITRASNLIQKFKTIAAENSHEAHEQIPIAQLCRDIHDSTQLIYAPTMANMELDIADELQVETNYSLLNQILSNLMSNIYAHAFAQGRENLFRVEAYLENRRLVVRLEDNGPGIAADVAEHMFEPFYTTIRARGGTGLGLSAAFNAATLLKGSVRYEGKSTLGGACFVLSIPVKRDDDLQASDSVKDGYQFHI